MNKLKELRKSRKKTQKEISEDLNIPYRTFQRWENGESNIKPDKAQQLADYFGVSVGYLMGYSGLEEIKSNFKLADNLIAEASAEFTKKENALSSDYEKQMGMLTDALETFKKIFNDEDLKEYMERCIELVNNIDGTVKNMLIVQAGQIELEMQKLEFDKLKERLEE
ncbi:helix-turn-helix domain-containing protein [Streptococcus sanguinis]|uniref:Helix-turn-helix transcriptional regulator n=1 Tax=Streptococcus sanguinis TaxID=1305 RepID=A0A7H8UZ46_STRSA|nr:helix-turn-helix transcriptional regulator [Streptococcus sanguinis]QLB49655.1 helix-turn-helix transcriptional regulator [Streptococcus sanguinis]